MYRVGEDSLEDILQLSQSVQPDPLGLNKLSSTVRSSGVRKYQSRVSAEPGRWSSYVGLDLALLLGG